MSWWNDLVYGIGDAVFASFDLLKVGNDYVNWLFIGAIAFILVGWVVKQIQLNKEAERTGGFK
jgi:hypothetical protein